MLQCISINSKLFQAQPATVVLKAHRDWINAYAMSVECFVHIRAQEDSISYIKRSATARYWPDVCSFERF